MRSAFKSWLLVLILVLIPLGTAFAASTAIAVSATILSKNNCKFNTANASLAFGDLNPLAPADVTRQATLDFVCNGKDPVATYLIGDDDGQNETGPNGNRMRHAIDGTTFLPYSFSMSPTTDSIPKGATRTLTVTGTVYGTDYQTALAGAYTDTITVTLNP